MVVSVSLHFDITHPTKRDQMSRPKNVNITLGRVYVFGILRSGERSAESTITCIIHIECPPLMVKDMKKTAMENVPLVM